MKLIVGVYGLALYSDPPRGVYLFVGPWAGRFNWPQSFRYSNGSRWRSGFHRWNEEVEF